MWLKNPKNNNKQKKKQTNFEPDCRFSVPADFVAKLNENKN